MIDNPYVGYHATYQELMTRRKQLESDTIQWREAFMKIFAPEETEFLELVQQSKEGKYRKIPEREMDKLYIKMAMIYKRWLPIQEQLKAMNPKYTEIFHGLDMVLADMDKKEATEKKEKKNGKKKISTAA